MSRLDFDRLAPFLTVIFLFLSFVPFPFHWLLAYVAFVPLFLRWERLKVKEFWYVGVLFWLLALYWIPRTLNSYGKTGWIVAVLAYFLLAFYLSLYWLVWGVFCKLVKNVWIAAIAFVFLEWLRLKLIYGFPLFFLSHSQADAPLLIQTASFLGQWGVGLGILLINIFAARKRKWLPVAALVLILVNAAIFFSYRGYSVPVRAALIQPALGEEEKWNPALKLKNIDLVIGMVDNACKSDVDIIITPETAVPVYWKLDSETFYVLKRLAACKKYVLLGVVGVKFQGEKTFYTNNAILLKGGSEKATYTKKVLVPFGEFVPLRGVLQKLLPFIQFPADFARGDQPPLIQAQFGSFVVGICYEMAFPDYTNKYAKEADFLVNITNDMWFGKTIAPYAHFWAAVFRAVENRKYLYRCANSGISAVIDPWGRVKKRLGLMKKGVLYFP
ncbi:apolipoprotein N-acyltransferase [Thermosulfidibacter takaii ABI70S6]|uniref:Apolipoprotein N-acyltransferase n=1 Tax=Thermosulfidibacter takaii (strain DSM 17441 / JCM 13301 / NBRC 103674 / ABI70S6) TaxID=1298851 RepID=A0A0S3QVW2_THET7|nr:apolipoprotein N-acyltransferase [Thermosulfidibacter takaii]BAT72477.1 apolipoprotein N-acyltransferase [Thermosulfidibacter takaii ABI70S6]